MKKETSLKLDWTNDDGSQGALNPNLVAKQELSQLQVNNIIDLHKHKNRIFNEMKATSSKTLLRDLAKKVEETEFKLQAIWGFPQDENFHYWWQVPQCSCPRMDNQDLYGTNHKIINPQCKVHGK